MSQAKALLEHAGVGFRKPSTLADSALILIDIQREYQQDGLVALVGFEDSLRQSAKLLARARAAGTPVIHVVHHGPSGSGFYDPTGFGGVICDDVAPKEGEPVICKLQISSFVGTDLEERLKATGRKNVIVLGSMTHMCVSTFVRAAVEQYGYACTVVADCTATRDLPNPGGGEGAVIKAEYVQASNLAALSDFFASVVPTIDDIKDQ